MGVLEYTFSPIFSHMEWLNLGQHISAFTGRSSLTGNITWISSCCRCDMEDLSSRQARPWATLYTGWSFWRLGYNWLILRMLFILFLMQSLENVIPRVHLHKLDIFILISSPFLCVWLDETCLICYLRIQEEHYINVIYVYLFKKYSDGWII